MVGVPSVRRSADLRVSAVLIWSEIHFFVCESHRRHPWGSFFSYCRLLPPREIAKFVLAHGLVGAVGIEPITQSNSAAPEHRRAALLRRVCKGRHPSP